MTFAEITDLNLNGLPQTPATHSEVQVVLGIVIGILGALALLFVVIGGFRYIISDGDPQGTAKARGTILYALIGLLIAVAAEAIVFFVFRGLQ